MQGHRESLQEYSPILLDQLVSMTAGGSVIAYAIYTIWPETVEKFGTTNLVYTVPLVLIGVMRYLYLVYNKRRVVRPRTSSCTNASCWLMFRPGSCS